MVKHAMYSIVHSINISWDEEGKIAESLLEVYQNIRIFKRTGEQALRNISNLDLYGKVSLLQLLWSTYASFEGWMLFKKSSSKEIVLIFQMHNDPMYHNSGVKWKKPSYSLDIIKTVQGLPKKGQK